MKIGKKVLGSFGIVTVIVTVTFFLLLVFLKSGGIKSSKKCIDNVLYNEEKNIYTCKYKGFERKFILCLPENCNKDTKLVLMLHGLGGSAAAFKDETKFEKSASPLNYAVVYIEGTVDPNNQSYGKGWHFYNDEFSKNDEAFLVELVKYLKKEYGLSDKSFAVGFSNGGFMVNKLASSRPDIFTAAVSVAGMMPKVVWESKKSKNPCAFLQINGTNDNVVPMELNGSSKYSQNPSIEKVIEYFRAGNKVMQECKEEKLSEVSKMYSYGTKVAWVLIQEGYHSWPKFQFAQIEADKVILDFFEKQ